MHIWYPQRSEEVFKSSQFRVINGFWLPCVFCELYLDFQQEQLVFLTSEPYIQILVLWFFLLILCWYSLNFRVSDRGIKFMAKNSAITYSYHFDQLWFIINNYYYEREISLTNVDNRQRHKYFVCTLLGISCIFTKTTKAFLLGTLSIPAFLLNLK